MKIKMLLAVIVVSWFSRSGEFHYRRITDPRDVAPLIESLLSNKGVVSFTYVTNDSTLYGENKQ